MTSGTLRTVLLVGAAIAAVSVAACNRGAASNSENATSEESNASMAAGNETNSAMAANAAGNEASATTNASNSP
jgi:hypothetical protein